MLMQSDFMQNVIKLDAAIKTTMLSVIMPNVIGPNVTAWILVIPQLFSFLLFFLRLLTKTACQKMKTDCCEWIQGSKL